MSRSHRPSPFSSEHFWPPSWWDVVMTGLPDRTLDLGTDTATFEAQLSSWRDRLGQLDPVFREDHLSEALNTLVIEALQADAPEAPLQAGGTLHRLIDVLLDEGAVPDHVPPTGGNYLISEVVWTAHPQRWTIAQHLLERGADPRQARSTRNAWHTALEQRQTAFVLTALAQGMTVEHNPLHHLLDGRDASVDDLKRLLLPIARALLDAGTSLEDATHWTQTPFLMAVERDHLDVAQLLLDRGADRHATRGAFLPMDNDQGWTALHLMAARNNAPGCTWLLERGLDLQARSFNGATPLDVAREHEAWESIAALERVALSRTLEVEGLDGHGGSSMAAKPRARL